MSPARRIGVIACAILAALVPLRPAGSQPTVSPSPEDVKELKTRYEFELKQVQSSGLAKKCSPSFLERAAAWSARADKALAEGRLGSAAYDYRQARWQLPYAPQALPEHLTWMSGNFRVRHEMDVTTAAFSPDGRLLATGSSDHTVKIWDLGNGHELLTYKGHTDPVRAIAFSPDGKTIATAQGRTSSKGDDAPVHLWNVATGKDRHILPGKGFQASALVFSRDGKYLIAGFLAVQADKHFLCIYETATGKLHRLLDDFRTPVTSIDLDARGELVALATGFAGGHPGEVRLWTYADLIDPGKTSAYWTTQLKNTPIQRVRISPDQRLLACEGIQDIKLFELPKPEDKIRVKDAARILGHPAGTRHHCLAFNRDGRTLFVGCMDGSIRRYDTTTGAAGTPLTGHAGLITGMILSPAGTQLASISMDRTLRLWDVDAAFAVRDFAGHERPIANVSFSPDGQRLISASADRTVKIWDARSGKVVHSLAGHTAPVTMALISPDSKLIASAGGDKVIKLWDADTGKHLRDLDGHTSTITAIDFAAVDGVMKLVSGGVDRKIKIWDVQAGKELVSIDDDAIVAALAFKPDGRQIAVGNVDQMIKLYDAASGKLQTSWRGHGAAISGLAYSPDGQLLASAGVDRLLRVWPLVTPGKDAITLSGHTGAVSAVAFRNDNRHLVSCDSERDIKLWKLDKDAGKEVQTYRGHSEWVTSVAFSKDGAYFVSGGVDRLVKLWEVADGEELLRPEHVGPILTLAVSPDGKNIATGGADRTIKIWDRASGAERFTFTGNAGAVTALAFTPDSKTLFSGAADKAIKRWDLSTGSEVPLKLPPPTGRPQNAPSFMIMRPDGKRLALWSTYDGSHADVAGFDPFEAKYLFRFNDVFRPTQSFAFSVDGRFLATYGRECSVRVFDMDRNNGIPVFQFLWNIFEKEQTGVIALTPDGSQVVCTNSKGVVRIGTVEGKQVLHTFEAHAGPIHHCVMSPDGKRLVTAGQDNLVKVWDFAKRSEERRWTLRAVTQLAFSADGTQLVSGHADGTLFVLDLP